MLEIGVGMLCIAEVLIGFPLVIIGISKVYVWATQGDK